MPLRIESRTYTVNPGECKKSPSKFFIWKNLRCRTKKMVNSVHEECRTEKINQQRSGPGVDEVAGLIEDNGNNDKTTSSVLPGSGSVTSGRSSSRRTRPLSLAVQPLNYHRLDPDNIITITTNCCSNNKHPNMTSQESIGNCSLDVDRSASDRSEATIDSISERTLHSLNLSYNGDTSPAINTPINSDKDIITNSNNNTIKSPIIEISNGDNDTEQVIVKKPSYLGLACSISGYSGITRYDSKLREGFRSRDSSPGSRLITRDSSPAGFRSSENLDIPTQSYQKNQSISPLAMDHQNGFTNGSNKECKIQNFVDTRTNNNDNQGYTEVDRGVTLHTLGELSPIHGTTSKNINYSRETTKTYTSNITFSSPKTTTGKQQLTFNETNKLNSSFNNYDNDSLLNSSTNSEKSFIQQRVERLYGPGALAQGFFFKRSSFNQSNSSNNSLNESRNNNSNNNINNSINNNNNNNSNSFIDNANAEESLKKLPVLRHLRPEFRAQLPVVSPRRPTDGTEQIIKPLQRLSIPIKKQDVNKSIILIKTNDDDNDDKLKLNTSVINNIPDQQLAAPVVVLPVLEKKINTNNGITEAKINIDDKKDGHYFIKLLKAEIKRLFALAESAEVELINGEQLPEEAAGKLRSAAGKARLLATQKMQQFEGLCHKNITQIPGEEFPTTDEDLAGFWDMVMLQVVQINDIFDHIDKLRKSQWQEIAVETKKSNIQNTNGNKRRITQLQKPKTTVNSEANRKVREAREQARRQMIEDRRKAMKTQVEPTVKIFAPKT
ncbi:hypothetical protein HCN44_006313 [Aphidius gifuensis]|uniref:Uncharacterized protein n=1 Tax=Aphidius gifuensis TaxID=684658 RepID=A0A834XTN0_APHGI|nr:hypothetical protein HCN44_006313 [Aphidius gifuensis]